MTRTLGSAMSRRRFLAAAGVTAGAAAVSLANTQCDPAIVRRFHQADANSALRHSVWVWQFSEDGPLERIAQRLAGRNLAVVLKTHDAVDWMSKWDPAPEAVSGPAQVATIAGIFEGYGVPFHAWCVVKGIDPVREAQMAGEVLDAGARSITLDLEDYDGFWSGTRQGAALFGRELRKRQPYARIDVSVDPRPWRLIHVPIREFVAFSDGIRPQLYWDVFNTLDNSNAYTYMGYPPGADGITPEFLLETTHAVLAPYDRWLIPIGQGALVDPASWAGFVRRAWELQMHDVSVWRYGVATDAVLDYLAAYPAGDEPPVPG